jgi:mannose/fructose/N-acetylgalactosamine-specific phosphotransferase system component IID
MTKSGNISLLILTLVISLTPVMALAQPDFGTGYLGGSELPTGDVRDTAINLINSILTILGVIVFIGLVYGGFMMMTAGGDATRRESGAKIVQNFAIGLVIIFLAFAITTFVFNILLAAS